MLSDTTIADFDFSIDRMGGDWQTGLEEIRSSSCSGYTSAYTYKYSHISLREEKSTSRKNILWFCLSRISDT